MIAATTYRGQRVAVFGLARSGITAALSLVEGGAEVLAWDDRGSSRDAASGQGVPVVDLEATDWGKIDALVLSPGVPHHLPKPHWSAEKARAADVPIICDVEIFAREMAAQKPRPNIVAITGTNGKSTTTTLIGHILRQADKAVHVGGNIGRGVLDLPMPGPDTTYVVELSSYQLERCPSLHADVAVLLNLSPDHLDRHGDMRAYEAAKRNIFANQTGADAAVIGVDDSTGKRIVTEMKARNGRRILPISTRSALGHGVSVVGGKLFDSTEAKSQPPVDLSGVETLRGTHNHQNAAAAYAACRALGLRPGVVGRGLKTFPGLAHRMERIGQAGRVAFVNDSKATNAEAAMQALKAFENIYWIAGGMPKSGGIEGLSDLFPRVAKAYLIGAAAGEFARTLGTADVAHSQCGELERAVRSAARDAFASGGEAVVLLSPACASFDQFRDFEVRGDAFRAEAERILDLYKSETLATDRTPAKGETAA